MTEHKQWMVVFIIYANLVEKQGSNSNDSKKINAIQEEVDNFYKVLKGVKISDRNKIIILENRIWAKEKEKQTIIETRSMEIVSAANGKAENAFRDLLPPLRHTEYVFQSAEFLGQLLQDVRSKYKGIFFEKTMVVTWDHGSIFGIFKVDIASEAPDFMSTNKSLLEKEEDGKKVYYMPLSNPVFTAYDKDGSAIQVIGSNKLFGNNSDPALIGDNFGILTNKELAEVLIKGLGKKVDILLMYNCCMQNVYTQYSLCEAVDFLVAPQGEIGEPGYNFEVILNAIEKNPLIQSENIGLIALSSLRSRTEYAHFQKKIEGFWALSLIDLKHYKTFINIVADCNDLIIKILKSKVGQKFKQHLKHSVLSVYHYDNNSLRTACMIDYNNFLVNIFNNGNTLENVLTDSNLNQELRKKINAVIDFMKRAKIGTDFLGNHLYDGTVINVFKLEKPASGFSIFFPYNEDGANAFLKLFLHQDNIASKFFLVTRWGEILKICLPSL